MTFFNANDHEPTADFEAIPKGDYEGIVIEAKMKATKAGDGKYLALTMQITDGQFRNRKLWENLNIENPSEQAMNIARGKLSSLCRAIGIMEPEQPEDLCDKPMIIRIGIRKDKETGEPRSVINNFKALDGAPPAREEAPVKYDKDLLSNAPPAMPAPNGADMSKLSPEMVVKSVAEDGASIEGPNGIFTVSTSDDLALEILRFACENVVPVKILVKVEVGVNKTYLTYVELPKF